MNVVQFTVSASAKSIGYKVDRDSNVMVGNRRKNHPRFDLPRFLDMCDSFVRWHDRCNVWKRRDDERRKAKPNMLRSDFYSLAPTLSQMLDSKRAAYERAIEVEADARDAATSRSCPVWAKTRKALRDVEISYQAAQEAFDSYWIARNAESKLRLY